MIKMQMEAYLKKKMQMEAGERVIARCAHKFMICRAKRFELNGIVI
jgi:hypothetical protein